MPDIDGNIYLDKTPSHKLHSHRFKTFHPPHRSNPAWPSGVSRLMHRSWNQQDRSLQLQNLTGLSNILLLLEPALYILWKKPYGSSKYIKYLYMLSNFAFNSVYFKKEKIKTKTTFIKLIARNGCVQLFHCYHLLTSHFVSVFSCS